MKMFQKVGRHLRNLVQVAPNIAAIVSALDNEQRMLNSIIEFQSAQLAVQRTQAKALGELLQAVKAVNENLVELIVLQNRPDPG